MTITAGIVVICSTALTGAREDVDVPSTWQLVKWLVKDRYHRLKSLGGTYKRIIVPAAEARQEFSISLEVINRFLSVEHLGKRTALFFTAITIFVDLGTVLAFQHFVELQGAILAAVIGYNALFVLSLLTVSTTVTVLLCFALRGSSDFWV